MRYGSAMIISFADRTTEAVWLRERVTKLPLAVQRQAARKLEHINAVSQVESLRFHPGNHLKKLAGDRQGQFSIRVNDRWRLCFDWTQIGAENVELVDYH